MEHMYVRELKKSNCDKKIRLNNFQFTVLQNSLIDQWWNQTFKKRLMGLNLGFLFFFSQIGFWDLRFPELG